MLVALSVLLLTGAGGLAASRLLAGSAWTLSAPRIALWAWVALSLDVVLGSLLAATAAARGSGSIKGDLLALWSVCAMSVGPGHPGSIGAVGSAVGLLFALVLLARVAWASVAVVGGARRERRRTAALTDMLGRTSILPGVTVLEHDVAYAFCVPGRHRRIVLTSAALERLTPEETNAVLAHERAHLAGRHHAPLTVVQILRTAFPPVRLFGHAANQVAVLVEVMADDVACRSVGARPLQGALHALADRCLPTSTMALAASSVAVETRLTRLATPSRPLRADRRLVALVLTAIALALPLVALTGPLTQVGFEVLCLVG